VDYKQASAVVLAFANLFSKARTLFLTGKADKSVRFLIRQSLCTPKHQ
jgi:hypothetical protein